MIKPIIGTLMLILLWVVFAWRAHREGALKPFLKGGAMGLGLGAFMFVSVYLIASSS
jgi:hypothetical protein